MTIFDRIELFAEAVEKAGLMDAFIKLSEIASNEVGAYLDDIIAEYMAWEDKPLARIRYVERDGTESYICEFRMSEEDDWSFDSSWELREDMIHYTALTKVRELMKQGYRISFK